jgi:hypothetical protein
VREGVAHVVGMKVAIQRRGAMYSELCCKVLRMSCCHLVVVFQGNRAMWIIYCTMHCGCAQCMMVCHVQGQ